jgi:hypothetical protein
MAHLVDGANGPRKPRLRATSDVGRRRSVSPQCDRRCTERQCFASPCRQEKAMSQGLSPTIRRAERSLTAVYYPTERTWSGTPRTSTLSRSTESSPCRVKASAAGS